MTTFEIRTDYVSDDLVAARRTIVGDGVQVQTPTTAMQAAKLRKSDAVDPGVCGVQELYRTFGDDTLTELSRGTDTEFVDQLAKQAVEVPDVLTVAFLKYTETDTLSPSDAALLVDILATTSDVITIPLMPKVARAVGEDERTGSSRDPAYRMYRESVERFLEAARERALNRPVMGVLPMVGWEYIRDLLPLYREHGVELFCLNFDRSRITAQSKVAMMRPLARHITRNNLEERVLLYAINLHHANRDATLGLRPGDDFCGFGMGLDVIGGMHESPNIPGDKFDEMEDSESFKLFDRIQRGYRDVPLDQLAAAIPDDLQLDGEFVQQRVEATGENTRRRYQKIINAEQMELAAKSVRHAMGTGTVQAELTDRVGVTDAAVQAILQVRQSFDDGSNQSNLGEF
ncbi:hypothetical protein [Natronomonas sp. LN261]|uniref:hypothetical protein n=1 Tax=Natronomonas sp. LN261 TaxID=2750669 RepID=UPI0015EEE69A|nr:hypothetical protein [Natronomonas sp. LN261]